jgi:hypothetical protein
LGVSCPETNIARAIAAELALVRKKVPIRKIRAIASSVD